MIRDGKPANFSGEGNLAGNLVVFAITIILFVAGLYMLNNLAFEDVWVPMLGVIILGSLAFFIPKQIIGKSNSVDEQFITDEEHTTKSPNL